MLAFRVLARQSFIYGRNFSSLKNYTLCCAVKTQNIQKLKKISSLQCSSRFFSSGDKEAPVVDIRDVEKIVKSRKLILLDVRSPEEFKVEGNIPTSVNINVDDLEAALKMDEVSFERKYGFKKPSKSDEIVVYCRKGKRSTTASEILLKNDFANVENFVGSWLAWGEKHPEDVLSKPEEK